MFRWSSTFNPNSVFRATVASTVERVYKGSQCLITLLKTNLYVFFSLHCYPKGLRMPNLKVWKGMKLNTKLNSARFEKWRYIPNLYRFEKEWSSKIFNMGTMPTKTKFFLIQTIIALDHKHFPFTKKGYLCIVPLNLSLHYYCRIAQTAFITKEFLSYIQCRPERVWEIKR